MENPVVIRPAAIDDAERLAELAGQLGYPNTPEDIGERMERYLDSPERIILVAQAEHRVVGWLSMEIVRLFYHEPFVEISGFVVDADQRNLGIGALMMAEAERWVLKKGLRLLRLKTNSVRKDAHRFYERLGFELNKEQRVYVKGL